MTSQYTDDAVDALGAAPSDAELITAVRAGDERAYADLWARHEGAAHRLARQIGNPSNADDLVSEAFLRVLRALKAGNGPDGAFRPYLFSTLRRINIDNGRSYYTRVALTDDERDLDIDHSDSAADVLADNVEGTAAWRAWSSLPDSTRTLLWHLIIEEETPAQIAPLIGTTPNGVSSRAVRAKERLRQAFLQQHLLDADSEPCRAARRRFGEYVRGALSARDQAEVRAHLEFCPSCPAALVEVTDINQTMKLIIGPAVLGGLLIAGHYAAATGVAAGAAKGGLLSHVTHFGHALKNPAIASATVAATVAAAGIAVGGIYVVRSTTASDSRPSTVAAAPGLGSGQASPSGISSAPAPSSSASPTSITPSDTPTSSSPTTPTPSTSSTPSKTKTTPRPTPSVPAVAVPPIVPSNITSSSTPPPVTPAAYVQSPISVTPASAPNVSGIQFSVPSDWVITDIEVDQPAGNNVVCPGFLMNRRVVTCGGPAPNAGEQLYTLTIAPESTSVTPAAGGVITWAYTDSNVGVPSLPLPSVPITTS